MTTEKTPPHMVPFEAVNNILHEASQRYGTETVQTFMDFIVAENLGRLTVGLTIVIGLIVYWLVFIKLLRKKLDGNETEYAAALVLSVVVTVAASIGLAYMNLNYWVWVGVFRPELAYMKDMLISK